MYLNFICINPESTWCRLQRVPKFINRCRFQLVPICASLVFNCLSPLPPIDPKFHRPMRERDRERESSGEPGNYGACLSGPCNVRWQVARTTSRTIWDKRERWENKYGFIIVLGLIPIFSLDQNLVSQARVKLEIKMNKKLI